MWFDQHVVSLCLLFTHAYTVPRQGVRNVPGRLRIRISRRRNDDEDAKVRSIEKPCWVSARVVCSSCRNFESNLHHHDRLSDNVSLTLPACQPCGPPRSCQPRLCA